MEALHNFINQYYSVSKERTAEILESQNQKIITSPLRVSVKGSFIALEAEIDRFINRHFDHRYWKEVKAIFKPEVVEFLWGKPLSDIPKQEFRALYPMFHDKNALRENKYFGDDIEYLPKKYIYHGEKLTKVMRKILREDVLDEILRDYCEIRNKCANKEETLVISNKIVDFFTMSENNYNWRSCMHWDEGEYRAGTLEMADSSNFLVAYIAGEGEIYPGIEDKKVRFLIYADEKAIIPIKMYPYYCAELFKVAVDALVEHLAKEKGLKYEIKEYTRSKANIYVNMNHFMYNDYGCNTNFIQYAAFAPGVLNEHGETIFRSDGRCKCLKCGEEVFSEESLLCAECAGMKRCENCGNWEDIEYITETEDGYSLCDWCYQHNTFADKNGDIYLFEENIKEPVDEE